MATSILRDLTDNGLVSVFTSDGPSILFACSKGHYWLVEASETGIARRPEEPPRGGGKPAQGGRKNLADEGLARIERTFGSEPLKAMGVVDSPAQ
jgi:hypothetical protein